MPCHHLDVHVARRLDHDAVTRRVRGAVLELREEAGKEVDAHVLVRGLRELGCLEDYLGNVDAFDGQWCAGVALYLNRDPKPRAN